jgi:hypothetical protein
MNQQLNIKALCTNCKQWTTGRLHFAKTMQLADSDGGIVFGNGWKCHNCLGEPWASADATVVLG